MSSIQEENMDITYAKDLIEAIPDYRIRRSLIHCSIEEGIPDELMVNDLRNVNVENLVNRLIRSSGCDMGTALIVLKYWIFLLCWSDESDDDITGDETDIVEEGNAEDTVRECEADMKSELCFENGDLEDDGYANYDVEYINIIYDLFSLGNCGERRERIQDVLGFFNEQEQFIIRYQFGLEDGQSHRLGDIENKYHVTKNEIRSLDRKMMDMIMNQNINASDDREKEMQTDTDFNSSEDQLHEFKDRLVFIIDTLSQKEQRVLELRFGLQDGRAHTLEEVGSVCDVTRERIREIEAKALRRARGPMERGRRMKDYLD